MDRPEPSGSREQHGFTLIELLIVVIILGVLAGITIMAVGATRSNSVATVCKTDVRTLHSAAEAVAAKSGYPTGTIGDSTSPNPFIVGAIPNNGAILPAWPESAEYALTWDGTSHEVEVWTKPPPPATPVSAGMGFAGCDAL
jgi:prepilin-type N-terminal cleavage/methylation domain-containing protein